MKKATMMLGLVLTTGLTFGRAGEMENYRDSSVNPSKITLGDLKEMAAKDTGVNSPAPIPAQVQTRTFISGDFTWDNAARLAMRRAVASLQNAGFTVIKYQVDTTGLQASYDLVFQAPVCAKIERFTQHVSEWVGGPGSAEESAENWVLLLESRGIAVLEKRVERIQSFGASHKLTISYLSLKACVPTPK